MPRASKKDNIFVHRNQAFLGGLKNLADHLNLIPTYRSGVTDDEEGASAKERLVAWKTIEQIVKLGEAGKLKDAAKQFTAQTAKQHPARMEVLMGKEEPIPCLELPADALGFALHSAWNYYFHNQGWTRLKRCPVCKKWFVDRTKNKAMARCSSTCTWKWWSRSQRKHAGHKGSTQHRRKGGTRHGKSKK